MVQQLIMSGSPSDACELTLDPNTANRRLSLSEDNRKVTLVGEFSRIRITQTDLTPCSRCWVERL